MKYSLILFLSLFLFLFLWLESCAKNLYTSHLYVCICHSVTLYGCTVGRRGIFHITICWNEKLHFISVYFIFCSFFVWYLLWIRSVNAFSLSWSVLLPRICSVFVLHVRNANPNENSQNEIEKKERRKNSLVHIFIQGNLEHWLFWLLQESILEHSSSVHERERKSMFFSSECHLVIGHVFR